MARYAHGCKSDINVIRVTKQLLVRYKAHSTGRSTYLVLQIRLRTCSWSDHMPQRWSTAIILLSGHSSQLPFKFASLHVQISATVIPNQRSFFVLWLWSLQKLVTVKVQRINVRRAQAQMTHLYHSSSPRLKGHLWRGVWNDCKIRQLVRTREKHCLLDLTGPPTSWNHSSCGCQHKIMPVSILACGREKLMIIYPN